MAEGKEKVVLAKKVLKHVSSTKQYERLDVTEGPTDFVEKHYLAKGTEIPKGAVIHCVYFYEK